MLSSSSSNSKVVDQAGCVSTTPSSSSPRLPLATVRLSLLLLRLIVACHEREAPCFPLLQQQQQKHLCRLLSCSAQREETKWSPASWTPPSLHSSPPPPSSATNSWALGSSRALPSAGSPPPLYRSASNGTA